MHPAAYSFVSECLQRVSPRNNILEYGGRNINGSVRSLFDGSEYFSIDIVLGPGVDLLADAATYRPQTVPDTIVCCEVLEHTPAWAEIIKNAGKSLDADEGVLILTCACAPRRPHSAVDGGEVRGGEYYGNIDPMQLTAILDVAGFRYYDVECTDQGDLQAIAWINPKE